MIIDKTQRAARCIGIIGKSGSEAVLAPEAPIWDIDYVGGLDFLALAGAFIDCGNSAFCYHLAILWCLDDFWSWQRAKFATSGIEYSKRIDNSRFVGWHRAV